MLQENNNLADVNVTAIEHILVVGLFYNEGQTEAPADCIMVANIDWDAKKITFTSIDRNLFVPYQNDLAKVNVLYEKDKTAMTKAVGEQLSCTIDGVIEVDTSGFEQLIDAIGGININLSEQEARYLNTTNYISKKENRNVMPGTVILNGNQAAGYARVRMVASYDGQKQEQGRISRHQQIMKAIFEKAQSMEITKQLSMVEMLAKDIRTDLTYDQLKECVSLIAKSTYTMQTEIYPSSDDNIELQYKNVWGVITQDTIDSTHLGNNSTVEEKQAQESSNEIYKLFPNPHD